MRGKERGEARESRSIIGQNNGQPFRDNDELALRSAYEYTYIHYALFVSSVNEDSWNLGRFRNQLLLAR